MAPAPPQVLSLQQLESIAGPGTLTWHRDGGDLYYDLASLYGDES